MTETPTGLDFGVLAAAPTTPNKLEASAAAAAVGHIPLEGTANGAPPAPVDADKEPHLPPPGTYFERTRNGGGGRVLADDGTSCVVCFFVFGSVSCGWIDGSVGR